MTSLILLQLWILLNSRVIWPTGYILFDPMGPQTLHAKTNLIIFPPKSSFPLFALSTNAIISLNCPHQIPRLFLLIHLLNRKQLITKSSWFEFSQTCHSSQIYFPCIHHFLPRLLQYLSNVAPWLQLAPLPVYPLHYTKVIC